MHLNWQIKPFSEISTNEFHDIIVLKIKSFCCGTKLLIS